MKMCVRACARARACVRVCVRACVCLVSVSLFKCMHDMDRKHIVLRYQQLSKNYDLVNKIKVILSVLPVYVKTYLCHLLCSQ